MRLGVLSYINSMPLTYGLESKAVPFEGEVVRAEPAALNTLADSGLLDVTPVSSVQFLRCHRDYQLVPGVCLAAVGEVQSVRLFSQIPIEQLAGRPVAITSASATSRVLLQILVPGVIPVELRGEPALTCELPATLLIGDRALWPVEQAEHVLDLGEAWSRRTGLPMVFAVWLAARRTLCGESPAEILERSRAWGETHRELILEEAARRTGHSRARLERYFGALTYRLDESALAGLAEFYRQGAALGLLPEGGECLLREPAPRC